MIRINLMRNRTQTGIAQNASSGYESSSSSASFSESDDQKGALKNLIFLFVGIGALILYENYNNFTLKESDLLLKNEYAQLEDQLNKSKAELERFKTSEVEAKALEDKLAIVRKLSRVRLREVKALDYIQEIIPDKVWLKNISFDQEAVRIAGFSLLDEDLSNFIQVLDRSSYFQNVVLTQAAEVATQSASYKQFDITARLELSP